GAREFRGAAAQVLVQPGGEHGEGDLLRAGHHPLDLRVAEDARLAYVAENHRSQDLVAGDEGDAQDRALPEVARELGARERRILDVALLHRTPLANGLGGERRVADA